VCVLVCVSICGITLEMTCLGFKAIFSETPQSTGNMTSEGHSVHVQLKDLTS